MDISGNFDTVRMQRLLMVRFGVQLTIDKMVAHNIAAGLSARATVFFADDGQLYCCIYGPSRLLLSDVKKLVTRIGLRPAKFFPPKGQPDYFDEFGRQKFKKMFPGFSRVTDRDIVFYRTLAPYSPALVRISEVKDGYIYQADSDSRSGWRVAAKCNYHQVEVADA